MQASQVFFVISSVGFVLLWILVAVALFYIIRITSVFSHILDKIEDNINRVGDTTKELLGELRDSTLFHFLSRKNRKNKQD